MVKYINHLSASGGVQSMGQNYGVGAKISAGYLNPYGLIYLSWKNGVGNQVHFWKDPDTGVYGLAQFERPDGSYGHWTTVDDALKPDMISDHGTKVILLGRSEDDDTMNAPEEARTQTKWIRKYLNSRYARLPHGISIRAREGWNEPRDNTDLNVTRQITGQVSYLEQHQEASGTVALSNASAHWWILKDEKALSQNSSQIESSGHIAALYQNELYELKSARAGTGLLQQFGVVFGPRRVVIYVEVDPNKVNEITTNTARTSLIADRKPLPWAEWAHEFRDKMPDAIKEHMERVTANSESKDHADSIHKRLKQIEQFFQLSRYRPTPEGDHLIDPRPISPGGVARETNLPRGGQRTTSGGIGGLKGSLYSLFQTPEGEPAKDAGRNPYPTVSWVSVKQGTRTQDDMEDRAAKYLSDQHMLLINADFRVFTDMIKRWVTEFQSVPGAEPVVTEVVREWFEQQLVEAVMSSFGLRGSREWNDQDIDLLLSEEALTAVVLPRYHTDQNVGRTLGTKLGARKTKVA
jgi:hypothetical protein